MRGDGTGEVIWGSLAVARSALMKWFVNWYGERGWKMGPGSVGTGVFSSLYLFPMLEIPFPGLGHRANDTLYSGVMSIQSSPSRFYQKPQFAVA